MPRWTKWKRLNPPIQFTPASLAETLDGGQAFRWHERKAGEWTGLWDQNVVRVRLDSSNRLEWSCPQSLSEKVSRDIPRYFAAQIDFDGLIGTLPHKKDPVLAKALNAWKGLRVIRQPFSETLLTFLCSSNKQIVQIKQICELLARRLGTHIVGSFYALPTWEALAEIPESELRDCKTGYRARFIHETACLLRENPKYLNRIEILPYEEGRELLRRLPGVGEKTADCVLLFGAGKLESFPVDTWIFKTIANLYHPNLRSPQKAAFFGRQHFGDYAGLAQQYLFASHRRQGDDWRKGIARGGTRTRTPFGTRS